MNRLLIAAAAAMLCTGSAYAAAPDDLNTGTVSPAINITGGTVHPDYKMDEPMIVRGWVVCVSESTVGELVSAHQAGTAATHKAYNNLAAAKSCGQFTELRVILKEPLKAADQYDVPAFEALVNLTGIWASAYVIESSVLK